MNHRARLAVPLVLTALAAAASPAAASARMSILYDDQAAVRTLTDPSGPGAAVTAERGAFRQDPGPGGIFDPQGRDGAYRIAKLSASEIIGLSPEAMADRIVRAAARGQRLLLPDRVSRLAWWASRLAPRWYARQMAQRLGGEMQGTE